MENELTDFEYIPIKLKKPDGTYMTAFRMVDLPKGEEGMVARHLNKRSNQKDAADGMDKN